ncbi:hypothetical protein GH857_00625 [Bacillus thuringiensis]|nr:hypothetical protein [Bacillus thuringiensis]MRA64317.1 hypothetical protein [Bacillus thuringiensis]MRB44840.1 hypothetical protein [Bacillus thuringiensis]
MRANTNKWEASSNYIKVVLKKIAHFTICTYEIMKMDRLAYLCASKDERSN